MWRVAFRRYCNDDCWSGVTVAKCNDHVGDFCDSQRLRWVLIFVFFTSFSWRRPSLSTLPAPLANIVSSKSTGRNGRAAIRPPLCGVGLQYIVPVNSEVTTAHDRQTSAQACHDHGDGSQSTDSGWYAGDGTSREQWWRRRRMSAITNPTGHAMKIRWNNVTTVRRDAISIISYSLTSSVAWERQD